jgi:hypothetical protein
MHGWLYSSDSSLSDRDLQDLADALAVQLHNMMGPRVFMLQRTDIAELIEPYICDLDSYEDQRALSWIVWHLFQDAHDIMMEEAMRGRRKR